VIVDMATDAGGNCELSVPDQIVERHGVILVGTRDLAASVPQHASELYAKNVLALVKLCTKRESGFELALGDEVISGALYCHLGALGAAKSAAKSA
jgi:NAD(P) transhydrogenase subunit alpha